ncbi:hypothetical protein [Winogradskyella helgolandensis]|uniref:hypothetical protein n=1 Tax=Winogradskyella helgolandensis TaxID=2697010 RepID=UPI0015C19D6C|nr:hypothetical protein [Winogradskyella helgolandensis]
MNKIFTLILALLLSLSIFAQAPEKMSYQAVVRDSGDNLVTNQAVGMQISILQGSTSGTAVYVETQTPTTNTNGLVSIEIGTGSLVSGNFSTIDWSVDSYFVKTETDPTGGTTYTITGTSELLSVPYALHAKTADSLTNSITELASFTINNRSAIQANVTNYVQLANSGAFTFNPNIFELQNSGNYGVKIKKDGFLNVSISQPVRTSANGSYLALSVYQNGNIVGISLVPPTPYNTYDVINLSVPIKVFENDIITIQFNEDSGTELYYVSVWPFSVYSFSWYQN